MMGDVDDMTGAKVAFLDLDGFQRTAYIETDHGAYGFGTYKHSGTPVWIRWGDPHREVPPIEARTTELREAIAMGWDQGYQRGLQDQLLGQHPRTRNPYREAKP